MPAGFQAFNAQGLLITDITDRISRITGTTVISESGSLTIPDLNGATPWMAMLDGAEGVFNGAKQCPVPVLSGNVITWSLVDPGFPSRSAIIVYGGY